MTVSLLPGLLIVLALAGAGQASDHASPLGLPGDPAHLDAAQAKLFQETAWAAVQQATAPTADAGAAAK